MTPIDIKLHKKTAILELKYEDGGIYSLPAEFLRVHSPSAEVQGHGPGQEVLQVEKYIKIQFRCMNLHIFFKNLIQSPRNIKKCY